jgi:hypothetical protein
MSKLRYTLGVTSKKGVIGFSDLRKHCDESRSSNSHAASLFVHPVLGGANRRGASSCRFASVFRGSLTGLHHRPNLAIGPVVCLSKHWRPYMAENSYSGQVTPKTPFDNLDALQCVDSIAQSAFDQIEATAYIALRFMECPESRQAAGRERIAKLLEAMRAQAQDAGESINGIAEHCGANYIDPAIARRMAAANIKPA